MSIATVDHKTYHQLEVLFLAQWLDQGMDLIAARNLVKEQMANAFRTNDPSRDDDHDARAASLGLTD